MATSRTRRDAPGIAVTLALALLGPPTGAMAHGAAPPAAPAALPAGVQVTIRLADPAAVLARPLPPGPPQISQPAIGRVVANPAGMLDINAAISGQVAEVLVLPGATVRAGDPIATVTSPDFIFTQRSYLALLENDERLEVLRGEGNLPNYLSSARENLRWWGMTEAQIDALVASRTLVERLSLVAPQDGIITEVLVQPGDMIDAGDRTMQNFIVLGRAVARMQLADVAPMLEVSAYPGVPLGRPSLPAPQSGTLAGMPAGASAAGLARPAPAARVATPPAAVQQGAAPAPSAPAASVPLMDGFSSAPAPAPPPASDATQPQPPVAGASPDQTAAANAGRDLPNPVDTTPRAETGRDLPDQTGVTPAADAARNLSDPAQAGPTAAPDAAGPTPAAGAIRAPGDPPAALGAPPTADTGPPAGAAPSDPLSTGAGAHAATGAAPQHGASHTAPAAMSDPAPVPDPRAAHVRLPFGGPGGGPVVVPVDLVAPDVNAITQAARALVSLGGLEGPFALGQTFPVELVREAPNDAGAGVWVPAEAVLSPDLGPVVYVQRADGAFDRMTPRVTGRMAGWMRLDGVAGDARVVIRGKTLLEGAYRRAASAGTGDPDAGDHHHH